MDQLPVRPSLSKRFRTNPIEFAIFAVISVVFMKSVYTLIYESPGFKPAALSPMVANPISEGRPNAGQISLAGQTETQCEGGVDKEVTAAKIRLSGSLCIPGTSNGSADRAPASAVQANAVSVTKTLITNQANRFNATVFMDAPNGKYTTDYIPLETGKNPIKIEFTYSDGKTMTQEYTLTRPATP